MSNPKTLLMKVQMLNKKANTLYQKQIILLSTYNLFKDEFNRLADEINELKKSEYEVTDFIIESLIREVFLYEDILESIENNIKINEKYLRLLKEVIEILFERKFNFNVNFDLILASSSIIENIRSIYKTTKNEITFIIISNSKNNFFNKDLIGLLIHEIAHLNQDINIYIKSLNPERRKIGESLADILAYIMVGPLYLYSLKFYIFKIVGILKSLNQKPWHPSLITRGGVLNNLSYIIWSDSYIKELIKKYNDAIFSYVQYLDLSEFDLLNKCIKKGKKEIPSFIKYKIDERELKKIKSVKKKDLNKLDMIIQLNAKIN